MENRIPFDLVPFRYLITRFTASMWPFVGMTVYFAIIFVIVDISGLVDIDSQLRHPTIFCIYLTYEGFALSTSIIVILSTGYPCLYGVCGSETSSLSNSAMCTNSSTNASLTH